MKATSCFSEYSCFPSAPIPDSVWYILPPVTETVYLRPNFLLRRVTDFVNSGQLPGSGIERDLPIPVFLKSLYCGSWHSRHVSSPMYATPAGGAFPYSTDVCSCPAVIRAAAGGQAMKVAKRPALMVCTHLMPVTEPGFCTRFIGRVYITSSTRKKNDPQQRKQPKQLLAACTQIIRNNTGLLRTTRHKPHPVSF